MVQTLDVISVNIWQILISLANLVLLFYLIKKFLFKPVKKILAKRQSELEEQYNAAGKAEEEALGSKKMWEEKLHNAEEEANTIVLNAAESAKFHEEKIIEEAKNRADSILKQAETEAVLTYQKAADKIKHEIVEVSGTLTEKILEREIDTEDHRNLIESFIEKIGDNDDGNQ